MEDPFLCISYSKILRQIFLISFSPAEDFADAAAWYLLNSNKVKKAFPNRAKILRRLKQLQNNQLYFTIINYFAIVKLWNYYPSVKQQKNLECTQTG